MAAVGSWQLATEWTFDAHFSFRMHCLKFNTAVSRNTIQFKFSTKTKKSHSIQLKAPTPKTEHEMLVVFFVCVKWLAVTNVLHLGRRVNLFITSFGNVFFDSFMDKNQFSGYLNEIAHFPSCFTSHELRFVRHLEKTNQMCLSIWTIAHEYFSFL